MKLQFRIFIVLVYTVLGLGCTTADISVEKDKNTITDADGNVYKTITIGQQTWMAENLKTTTFNDGVAITEHEFGMDWGDEPNQTPQFQWADTNDLNDVVSEELPFDYYGALYNHWALESGKLAPVGWRIPSLEDFEILEEYLTNNGFENQEANALKSISGWLPSSGNGLDAIQFNGLPNGYINAFGTATLGQGICTWATTNSNVDQPESNKTRIMVQLFEDDKILYSQNSFRIGAGIRCIKE